MNENNLLARFQKGSNVMDGDIIEYWRSHGDRIVRRHYGNGGADEAFVSEVPDAIEGYERTEQRAKK